VYPAPYVRMAYGAPYYHYRHYRHSGW
jgi:hypothetical protein